MPENIHIAFFILGGIFLLISILGGNFKIFGAEISATTSSKPTRVLCFIMGIILIFLSLNPNFVDSSSKVYNKENINSSFDISGKWSNGAGSYLIIVQENNQFTFSDYDAWNRVVGTGKGSIVNKDIDLTYGSSVYSVNMKLSQNNKSISGILRSQSGSPDFNWHLTKME